MWSNMMMDRDASDVISHNVFLKFEKGSKPKGSQYHANETVLAIQYGLFLCCN
jgi:hypothetical protein